MNKPANIEAATLHSAMALAFPKIEGATKDANNPHFKSKYADLSSVVAAVKPALSECGLFFTQSTHEAQGGVCVETVVHHASGESMSFGKLFVPANKNDAQGFGSALTYARRYSLMTAFGVPAEDDDGNAAAKSAPKADATPVAATDAQRDIIQQIASAVGKPLEDICAAYKVASLKGLTAKQADATITRLQAMAPKKETVDA